VDLLKEYCELFDAYLCSYHPREIELHEIVKHFAFVLEKLDTHDFDALNGYLDWVAKLTLLENYRQKKGLGWQDARIKQVEIKYHLNNYERGLWRMLRKREGYISIVTPEEITYAARNPPATRSMVMRRVLERYENAVKNSDCWREIQLTHPGDPKGSVKLSLDDPRLTWDERYNEFFLLDLAGFLSAAKDQFPGAKLYDRGPQTQIDLPFADDGDDEFEDWLQDYYRYSARLQQPDRRLSDIDTQEDEK
jgi:hypothetical protein